MSESGKRRILSLCTGNSCRSQVAEGWARHLKSDVLEPCSAGIETHGLNPNAVKVMSEAGVDISAQASQNIREFENVPLDYVVTVCEYAAETCPVFPGNAKVVHKSFPDPPKLAEEVDDAEAKLDGYRGVRDEIRAFVEPLPEALEAHR